MKALLAILFIYALLVLYTIGVSKKISSIMKAITLFFLISISAKGFAQMSGWPEQDSLLVAKGKEFLANGKTEYYHWLNYQWICWTKGEIKERVCDLKGNILHIPNDAPPEFYGVREYKIKEIKYPYPISFKGWMNYKFSVQ